MGHFDFSLKEEFSWEDFCSTFRSHKEGWEDLHDNSRQLLEKLDLSAIYPHCVSKDFSTDAPPMGPLTVHDYHDTFLDEIITFWNKASPALLAMSELWLRLFAAALAPICIAYMLWILLGSSSSSPSMSPEVGGKHSENRTDKFVAGGRKIHITVTSVLSLFSALVLATDMWYVYHYGSQYGISLLLASSVLAASLAFRHRLLVVSICLIATLGLTFYLCVDVSNAVVQFGGNDLPHSVSEGLYYDTRNTFISKVGSNWPIENRTYSAETGATPWTPTGDSRTGIPFLVNFWPDLELTRVWLPTVDDEAVRLEISFPASGHDFKKPLYVILHGLSGGSQEEYIKDFVHRVNGDGSTAVIMIARGLMDTPTKGWNVFHGARTSDIDSTAKALRRAVPQQQTLVGAGFSMGAIILANYVARSGKDCALDTAVVVSGLLDARLQYFNDRAKRLWQPMLTITLRDEIIMGKVAERYRQRLGKKQMMELMRATHITGLDKHAVVTYNGYRDVMHYYAEMSAMGDFTDKNPGRIANVSIPLLVVHALDDPLITWKAVVDNEGPRHPSNLVQTGSGNLMILLTKAGGHIGWPLGLNPSERKWEWMSNLIKSFATTLHAIKQEEA